jgi:hypothetical protein
MSDDEINRRELIVKAPGAAGTATTLTGVVPPMARTSLNLPSGFQSEAPPFAANWHRELSEITQLNLAHDAPELDKEEVKERHRIYSYPYREAGASG